MMDTTERREELEPSVLVLGAIAALALLGTIAAAFGLF